MFIKSLINVPRNALAKYNKALLNSPYKTKMITAGTTYFIADYISQSHIEKKPIEDYSLQRSFTQGSVGAFFAAPSLHVWHSMLLPKIARLCTSNITRVLVSVFLNETVLATYFISCLLFSFEALKTMNVQAGAENVEKKFKGALQNSMKFWTGISLINYSLMPVHLRPVFVSCWSMVWQSYLSYVSNNQNTTTADAVVEDIKPVVAGPTVAMVAASAGTTQIEEREEDDIDSILRIIKKGKVVPFF